MRRFILTIGIGLLVATPNILFAAQQGVSFKTFTQKLIGGLNEIVIPILFAFAFLFFLYGVFKYFILGGDSDTSRKEGHMFILWGIVALAVMVSTWGLVRIFMNTFGLG